MKVFCRKDDLLKHNANGFGTNNRFWLGSSLSFLMKNYEKLSPTDSSSNFRCADSDGPQCCLFLMTFLIAKVKERSGQPRYVVLVIVVMHSMPILLLLPNNTKEELKNAFWEAPSQSSTLGCWQLHDWRSPTTNPRTNLFPHSLTQNSFKQSFKQSFFFICKSHLTVN